MTVRADDGSLRALALDGYRALVRAERRRVLEAEPGSELISVVLDSANKLATVNALLVLTFGYDAQYLDGVALEEMHRVGGP